MQEGFENYMRIAIMGSHSTGKSTLGKKICQSLGFNFIPDTASMACKNNFIINEITPPETQFWIMSKQLEFERNIPEPWIEEKSLYDNLIYGRYAKLSKNAIKVIEDIVERNAKYDLIFYLPIEFAIEDDGVRSMDLNFQKKIDQDLRLYLKSKNLPFVVLRGSVKERVRNGLKYIKMIEEGCKIINLN